MALENIVALPRDGSEPVDGLLRAGPGDCLIAMTFKPYRREVVEAVEAAKSKAWPSLPFQVPLRPRILSGPSIDFWCLLTRPNFSPLPSRFPPFWRRSWPLSSQVPPLRQSKT